MRYVQILLTVLILLFLPIGSLPASTSLPANSGVTEISEGWEYRQGDSPFDTDGNPLWANSDPNKTAWIPLQKSNRLLSRKAEKILWFRVRLPEGNWNDPTVFLENVIQTFEVYLDNTRIYTFGGIHAPDRRYSTSDLIYYHIVPLPKDFAGKYLYFRIYSEFIQIGIRGKVTIGSRADHLTNILHNGTGKGIVTIVSIFIGLFGFAVFLRQRSEKVFLAFGSYAVGFGMLTISLTQTKQLYYANPFFWNYIRFGTAFVILAGLAAFFEEIFGAGYKSVFRRLWQIDLALGISIFLLEILGLITFTQAFLVLVPLIVIIIACILWTVVKESLAGNKEARILAAGAVIFGLAGFHDVFFTTGIISASRNTINHLALLFYLMSLAWILIRRFIEVHRQLGIYSDELKTSKEQLEDYSKTLEYKVREKTHELEEKNDELEKTLHEVKAMQNQIIVQEKMASLGALTAGIAHEIKNPLNFVNNFSELSVELAQELQELIDAHKENLADETVEDVNALVADLIQNMQTIHKNGQRMDSIVKNMLLHSRGKAGEKRPIDINALLDEYVSLAYHGMRAQNTSFNITLAKEYDHTIEKLRVVPQDLGRVFLNIMNNSFYSTHKKKQAMDSDFSPKLQVSTKNLETTIEIRFHDNGEGIPRELLDKIFHPFFTTKPTGEGTGLGLSLSYDIVVKEHQGDMRVETEEGVFTEFIIEIPK